MASRVLRVLRKLGSNISPVLSRCDPHSVKAPSRLFPLADRAIGNLQQWLIGTYHGVSKPQLQVYLDEFVFRHNRRNTPAAAFQTLLGLGTGRKSTEYEQIRGAKDLNPNILGLAESTGSCLKTNYQSLVTEANRYRVTSKFTACPSYTRCPAPGIVFTTILVLAGNVSGEPASPSGEG